MVSRQLPAQQLGLAGQPAYCLLETLQRLQLAAQPAILPVQPTGLPVQPTGLPVQPTGLPVQPTGLPVQPTGLPVQPTGLPVQPTGLPVQPTGLPVQPTGLPVQGTDFPAQRLDRVLLLPRPFQRLAQPGARAGRRSLCRSFRSAKRRDLPAQRHELVLLLLRALQRLAQPGVLPRQRPGRVLPRAGAGAALSGRGPPPGGARSHSSGPAMPARLRATGRLPCAAT